MPIRDNELLIEVEALNIDSASFHQIKEACGSDVVKMQAHIEALVKKRGKHHNPVTGSGGMLIGTVKDVGARFLEGRHASEHVKKGDRVATLVSLTLTPLEIRRIRKIHLELDRVDVEGHAILFQSGIYAKLPSDIPETLALAVLDVCGAPAQTAALCKPGQTVLVIGGGGKSGLLCLYEAKKAVGKTGQTIGLDYGNEALQRMKSFSFVDTADLCDARAAVATHELVKRLTNGKMADVVINVTNIPDTEMSCILSAKSGGIVYYFSMATSFTKATLGAEGVGADVELIMGNGYRP
ncbi:MAG: L-erythro-3,5-diaminohexanoate dehydrogenase, partial [Deltaproteobacteria bacterium]|nr:L-erythro-3,5-diaminohexanoate dehydrogenase [Deltaproteobacteria bacterium]